MAKNKKQKRNVLTEVFDPLLKAITTLMIYVTFVIVAFHMVTSCEIDLKVTKKKDSLIENTASFVDSGAKLAKNVTKWIGEL